MGATVAPILIIPLMALWEHGTLHELTGYEWHASFKVTTEADFVVDVRSDVDLVAQLYRAKGKEWKHVATNDDRPGNHNPLIRHRLCAGWYRLTVKPFHTTGRRKVLIPFRLSITGCK